jgi:hypothetical protein
VDAGSSNTRTITVTGLEKWPGQESAGATLTPNGL